MCGDVERLDGGTAGGKKAVEVNFKVKPITDYQLLALSPLGNQFLRGLPLWCTVNDTKNSLGFHLHIIICVDIINKWCH